MTINSVRVGALIGAVVLALASASSPAVAAFHSYTSIKGKKTGAFKGESSKNGAKRHGKWGEVRTFNVGSETPVDIKGGGPKGARHGHPLKITKKHAGRHHLAHRG